MAVQVSYPGVYIEEFTPGAPIEGVGTSTAAFIGVAAKGDLDTPTKITSWDQFREIFGEHPVPGFYLWYAVRGFFENGGQVCYVVRASNGAYAGLGLSEDPGTGSGLLDRADNPMLRVRARQPGEADPLIQVEVAGTNLLPSATTQLYRTEEIYTAIIGREITLQSPEQAASFRPTDWIVFNGVGEPAQVLRVTGNTVRLVKDLPSPPPEPGTIRLANVPAGTRTVRIESTALVPPGVTAGTLPANVLVPGAMLTIEQGAFSDSQIVETVQTEPLSTSTPLVTYRVTFRQGLDIPLISLDLAADVATVKSEEFHFKVSQDGNSTVYADLSIDPAHPRHFLTTINDKDALLQLELLEPPPPVQPPQNLPLDSLASLLGGANEDLSLAGPTALGSGDFIDALETLRDIDDVNLIAIPDCVRLQPQDTAAVQQELISHCEQMGDRFAVLDARPGLAPFGSGSIEEQRLGLDSTRGYAALYYPWLHVRPAGRGAPILVPPSGHVCGIVARSDNSRGVHKAPANEIVNGALAVEVPMGDVDHGQLNIKGINVIRVFQTGSRPVLWGARTTATDRNWQYVNIRRLFLFLEESIQEGVRWAVFEPNNRGLWEKLRRTITEFLIRVWRDGALFGTKPEEACYVRIDETLNPDSVRALGRLYIEIGVRPSYPAEFIIVRIGIWAGGSEAAES